MNESNRRGVWRLGCWMLRCRKAFLVAGVGLAGLPLPYLCGNSGEVQDMLFGTGHRDARLSLETIVENAFGKRVLPWDGQHRDKFREVIRRGAETFNQSGCSADRMNEISTKVEDCLMEAFRVYGISAALPKTRSGRTQRSGYPDLRVKVEGQAYYLEVKTYSAQSRTSSHRAFYLSNSPDPKVLEDAIHLLVGFEVEKRNDNSYRVTRFLCRDIRELACKVKIEFNASNLDMYRDFEDCTSISGEVQE
ncbi:MAG: hypothetical protein JW706_02030 [Opitutales bacterium]|nr:hypothetical protein [Opitutales bacterium]